MALFGLFGKKKDKRTEIRPAMPRPPIPPSPLDVGDKSIKPPQHVDDLGMGIGKSEGLKSIKDMELPELEFPKLDIPSLDEEEINKALEAESKPNEPFAKLDTKKKIPMVKPSKKEVPEHLPDIEETPEPMAPKVELVDIEEPIDLKPTPSVKGPVFIRSDQFKAIKTNVNGLREGINKAEEILNNVVEIKNREESEYENWHGAAESIQRKLLYVDKMLFE